MIILLLLCVSLEGMEMVTATYNKPTPPAKPTGYGKPPPQKKPTPASKPTAYGKPPPLAPVKPQPHGKPTAPVKPQRVTCYNRRSKCFLKYVTCPVECPKVQPKDGKAKGCFLDCYSPKCEAVCRGMYINS